jgi:hypothetical protein
MKAVMSDVPPFILSWRKQTGAERFDEMWEGVLHMTPSPNFDHQNFEGSLETWLRIHWASPLDNMVCHQINVASVGGWPNNYRIPDLVLLTPDRFHINQIEYLEGPPTVVVEIQSPGDESYEKLPFYAKIGVGEVWIIDRDTKAPAVYLLQNGEYKELEPDAAGWLHSAATGILLRGESSRKLTIQLADDANTLRLLPD